MPRLLCGRPTCCKHWLKHGRSPFSPTEAWGCPLICNPPKPAQLQVHISTTTSHCPLAGSLYQTSLTGNTSRHRQHTGSTGDLTGDMGCCYWTPGLVTTLAQGSCCADLALYLVLALLGGLGLSRALGFIRYMPQLVGHISELCMQQQCNTTVHGRLNVSWTSRGG